MLASRFYSPDIHVDRASETRGLEPPRPLPDASTPALRKLPLPPVTRFVQALARLHGPIQSGNVNSYLLYILVVVVIAYFVAAR
jgi:hydrogenase-4 component B